VYLYSVLESREMSQRCRADENRCVFSAHVKAFCDSSDGSHFFGSLCEFMQMQMHKHAGRRCTTFDCLSQIFSKLSCN